MRWANGPDMLIRRLGTPVSLIGMNREHVKTLLASVSLGGLSTWCLLNSAVPTAFRAKGSLEGAVLSADGHPITGAVELIDVNGRSVARSPLEGADGSFSFDHLPDGDYTIRLTANGHAPVREKATVEHGEGRAWIVVPSGGRRPG